MFGFFNKKVEYIPYKETESYKHKMMMVRTNCIQKIFNRDMEVLGKAYCRMVLEGDRAFYSKMTDQELASIYLEYYGTEEEHHSFEDFYYYDEEEGVLKSKTVI